MMRPTTIACLAVAALALSACGYTRKLNATLDGLRGQKEEAAVDKYGPPADVYQTENKRYLVFIKNKEVVVPAMPGYTSVNAVGRTVIVSSTPGTSAYTIGYWCKLTLTLDRSSGQIENYRWEGNWCRVYR